MKKRRLSALVILVSFLFLAGVFPELVFGNGYYYLTPCSATAKNCVANDFSTCEDVPFGGKGGIYTQDKGGCGVKNCWIWFYCACGDPCVWDFNGTHSGE